MLNMMNRNKIVESALSLGAVQLFTLLLPTLSLPYLAKMLGADSLGKMAFALSTAQIFMVLTDYGFNISAPKEISVHRENRTKVAEIWMAVTTLRTIFAVLGILLLLALGALIPQFHEELALLLVAYVAVLGNIIFPQWLFQGLEKLRLVSIIQIVTRIIVFTGVFLIVKSPADLYWATFLQSVGTLLGGLMALPLMFRALGPATYRLPSAEALIFQLKEGWHLFLSTAAVNLYTSSNAFLLGMLAAPSVVGHFHVAEKLIRAVQMMYAPISSAVYPHVARLAVTSKEAVLDFNRKLLLLFGAAAIPACLLTFVLARFVIGKLFGDAFLAAAPVLQIFSLLPLLMVVSNILGIQTMLPFGMKAQFGKILVGAAFIDLIVFIPGVRYFGAEGAASANVLIELFVTCAMATVLRRAGCSPLTRIFESHIMKKEFS